MAAAICDATAVMKMTPIRLFLVDPNQLFRDGLTRVLTGEACTVVGEARTLAEARGQVQNAANLDLLVADFSPDADADAACIEAVRTWHTRTKVVILTSEQSHGAVLKATRWSVDAYLTKDMSADVLMRSFQLVLLGQEIFPTKLMLSGFLGGPAENTPSRRAALHGLTPREAQILCCLKAGDTNKTIARKLDISEATVKVHLKALLRKVRVNNRTQAAIWAMNNMEDEAWTPLSAAR
jgi:two-component system, NarL family, nitrate/nitrite response regulator NarL